MRTRGIAFWIILALLPLAASASPSNQWELYQAYDWTGRLDYLNATAPENLGDDFLLQALAFSDAARIEAGGDTEVQLKRTLAIKLVKLLGDRKVAAAVAPISRLPGQYKDPQLKGECWLALAKLGAQAEIPGMVRALAGLNDSGQRSHPEEMQAAYLIQALGILGANDGFRAVTAAAYGWYTPASGVRALAKKTMPLLTKDLDGSIDQLLASDGDLALLESLFQDVRSTGTPERSGKAAAALLTPLVRLIPSSPEDQDRAYRMLLAGLASAQKSPSPPASLVPSLKYLLMRNEALQPMIQAVQLLGHIADPAAVAVLVERMRQYNERQVTDTNSPRDQTLIHETILALGLTGQAAARAPLEEGKFAGYTPAVVREITDALAKLPRG